MRDLLLSGTRRLYKTNTSRESHILPNPTSRVDPGVTNPMEVDGGNQSTDSPRGGFDIPTFFLNMHIFPSPATATQGGFLRLEENHSW